MIRARRTALANMAVEYSNGPEPLRERANIRRPPPPQLQTQTSPMPLHAATIFLSAFLLFLVQPILAKQILPWFGGAAIVWTTCMVFFQFVLLLGYAYSHWVTTRVRSPLQNWIHIGLLVASLAFLPIVPGEFWKPAGDENPVVRILLLLFATIGLPYFLLSSTSPLIQAWFAREFPGSSPYRLFALSNFASMLALLGYPFLFEPWLASPQQSWAWSGAYFLFVVTCATLTLRSRPLAPPERATPSAAFMPKRSRPPTVPIWRCSSRGASSRTPSSA